jgi:hypothetical protein
MKYHVRYVHKIAPRDTDVLPEVELPPLEVYVSRAELGKVLRDAGVMISGARVTEFRAEREGLVVFPSVPGLTTYWHSIILTPIVTPSIVTPSTPAGTP